LQCHLMSCHVTPCHTMLLLLLHTISCRSIPSHHHVTAPHSHPTPHLPIGPRPDSFVSCRLPRPSSLSPRILRSRASPPSVLGDFPFRSQPGIPPFVMAVPFAFKDLMTRRACNSHYFSHMTTFFIDARAKRSLVKNICLFLFLILGCWVGPSTPPHTPSNQITLSNIYTHTHFIALICNPLASLHNLETSYGRAYLGALASWPVSLPKPPPSHL
jgi:hypothetical protein